MAFSFDSLKSRVQSLYQTGVEKGTVLAQTGAEKAQQVASMAKLKAANVAEEETLRRAYQELGRLYFEKHGLAPEEEFLSACAAIDESLAKLQINQSLLDELSAEFSGTASVEIVPEVAPEAAPTEPEVEAAENSDPLADLDAFIEKTNAEADGSDEVTE